LSNPTLSDAIDYVMLFSFPMIYLTMVSVMLLFAVHEDTLAYVVMISAFSALFVVGGLYVLWVVTKRHQRLGRILKRLRTFDAKDKRSMAALKDAFRHFDSDKSGTMERDEVAAMIPTIYPHLSKDECEGLLLSKGWEPDFEAGIELNEIQECLEEWNSVLIAQTVQDRSSTRSADLKVDLVKGDFSKLLTPREASLGAVRVEPHGRDCRKGPGAFVHQVPVQSGAVPRSEVRRCDYVPSEAPTVKQSDPGDADSAAVWPEIPPADSDAVALRQQVRKLEQENAQVYEEMKAVKFTLYQERQAAAEKEAQEFDASETTHFFEKADAEPTEPAAPAYAPLVPVETEQGAQEPEQRPAPLFREVPVRVRPATGTVPRLWNSDFTALAQLRANQRGQGEKTRSEC